MRQERVRFANARGVELAGLIDLPDARPAAYALFAHCFTCTKNLRAASHIANPHTAQGIGVMRIDFTGLGQSAGEFADSNFSTNVADLVAAAAFLAERYAAPKLLVGHSLGGTAVLQAAPDIDASVAVATIGAPARASHVAHLLADARGALERDGVASVVLAGRPFTIRKQFLDDLERHPLPESVHALRRALLIMHSPVDAIVPIENAAALFEHALHPKSYVSLDRADHLLSQESDAHYVGAVLATWASRYLGIERGADDVDQPTRPGEVLASTRSGTFHTVVATRGHEFTVDEPQELGGGGAGPTPYDLIAAGLAACSSMTLQLYAKQKEWPLEVAVTRVTHTKIHAADCADCETREGRIDRFERRLELKGPLSDAQRDRLRAVADKCPVHRTLHGEIEVVTRLMDGTTPSD
jgi:putative redox protein